jgi:hypothetical protein
MRRGLRLLLACHGRHLLSSYVTPTKRCPWQASHPADYRGRLDEERASHPTCAARSTPLEGTISALNV